MSIFHGMYYSPAAAVDASGARSAARRSESKASDAQWEVRSLTERVDKLSLICMAMWQLLKDKTDLTEEDLMQRVQKLDLADGVADGKVTKQVRRCPKCDRAMNPRHKRCLYCGGTIEATEVFDNVT